MNEQAILHIPESGYCFAGSGSQLVLRLRMDRRDEVDRVEILLECKYRFQEKQSCYLMEKNMRTDCLLIMSVRSNYPM